jgi:hypothetical protein
MKILGREEQWIHTHFLTDCTRLSEKRMREIVRDMAPYLREQGIVYGMHFTQLRDESTCRIVLECIPFPMTLDRIQQKLQEVVRDIPARPVVTKTVRDEQSQAPLVASR